MKISAMSAAFMAVLLAVLLGMPSVVRAQGSSADTLIVGVQNDTPNLAPWDQATNSVWKAFLWANWVYEGLYGLSPDGSVYPVLATDYTVDGTGLNYTIHLRQGVTFTDGDPMDADDVVFTYQIMAFNSQLSDYILKSIVWQDPPQFDWWNSTTAWGSTHKSHTGVIKVDQYTVRLQLRQKYSMFFFYTLTRAIMPSHIWKDHLATVTLGSYELPGGTKLTQGTEFDFDKNFGSQQTDVQATIGTGPWYLESWTRSVSSKLSIYNNYWGKAQSLIWQGKQWPYFPKTIRHIEIRIYGTLDVAVLALKSGEVHIVPWNLPIGFYNDLRRDPNMGFKIPTSDGFYYIAYNMRKEPFNDINFRRAVSYVVDKDFIVDRLLGGFGIKGQIPVSPINPAYINSSAVAPPFNLDQARTILNTAGYTDKNGDGWRELPDGRPMKYSILTPAKDYDPVRADAGIMISNNLKAIGLNIDSSPTAFDAIVSAVFTAVQFDMYILGWVSLGPFPESYLFDFFACSSDATLGVGSNTPGFCNAEFDAKIHILDTEMNDAVRIQAAKDAEGILVKELPYTTLYNTRQIEAYRADVWSGWTDVNGEIFNAFSFSILGASGVSAPTGPLTVSLNMPGQAVSGSTVHFQVYTVQNGAPASGTAVNVTAMTGEWATGITDSQGYADISFILPTVEVPTDVGFIAVGTSGTNTGGDAGYLNIVPANDVAQLLLSSSTPVVAPGGTATITAKVTNKLGAAIPGVPVEVIPELVLGTVNPSNATTNAQGIVTFTYTAPPVTLVPNKNQYDFIKASVFDPTKLVIPDTKIQTLTLGVENTIYDWYVVSVESVTAYAVDTDPGTPTIPLTSDVTVKVAKQDGTAVVGENVTVALSNSTALLVDSARKLTGVGGTVAFTFTANSTESTPVAIDFNVEEASFAMSGLSMLVTNGTSGYAMITSTSSRFVNPNTPFDITMTVYDETGGVAAGKNVKIFVPYNPVGNPIRATATGWTFTNYVGTTFNGTTDVAGQVTTSASTLSFTADNLVTLETGVAGYGPSGAFILGSPASTYANLNVIQKRNKLAAAESFAMAPALATPGSRAVNVTVKFRDVSGVIVGANVSVYRGKGDLRPGKGATKIGYFFTDTNGEIKAPWIEPLDPIDTALFFTAVVTSNVYALGGVVGSTPFEIVFPYLTPPSMLAPTGTTDSKIVRLGDQQTYRITVKDFSNLPVQDAVIKARIASNVSAKTTGEGLAVLRLVPGTSNPAQTDVSEVIFDISKGGQQTTLQLGTLVGVGAYSLSNLQIPSSATVGKTSTISVQVNNTGPVGDYALVTLSVDSAVFASKQVLVGAHQTVTVEFTYVPYDTSQHTLAVAAPGATPLSGPLTAAGAGGGIDTAVAVVLAIVLLIVGFFIGFFLGKRPKAPAVAPETPVEEAEAEEKPAEEEKKV